MSERDAGLAWFRRWIFSSYEADAHSLALCRIFYALFMLLFALPDFRWIAGLPLSFFLPPPGPMQLVPALPPAWFFGVLQAGVIVALTALLIGFRTRTASLLSGALLFVGSGFYFSFGKINHNILVLVLPVVMAASNWGSAFSYDALRARAPQRLASWPLTYMGTLVGFAMFTAGYAKVVSGWLDPSTHAVQGHLFHYFHAGGRQDWLAPFFVNVRNGLFWESVDYATVIFELGFLLAIFHAPSMRLLCGVAVVFHVGVMMMLNIVFVGHLAVYSIFFSWSGVGERIAASDAARRVSGWARRVPPVLLVLLGSSLLYAFGSPLVVLDGLVRFSSGMSLAQSLLMLCGFVVVVVRCARFLGRRGWRDLAPPGRRI